MFIVILIVLMQVKFRKIQIMHKFMAGQLQQFAVNKFDYHSILIRSWTL